MTTLTPRYTIDTCSLTALRRVYPEDVFPGVWTKVSELADNGDLISVEDVYEELSVFDDVVLDWAKEHSYIFAPLDAEIQLKAAEILENHSNLLDLKKRKSSADPFLVALAIVRSCIVVTEEMPSGGPDKSKIPDVCRNYGVPCVTLLDMLRAEGLRL
jgi:hypothetical protein